MSHRLSGLIALVALPLLGSILFLIGRDGAVTAFQATMVALICSACVGLAVNLAQRTARRIRRLTLSAEDIRGGVRTESLPVESGDEIGRLAVVINDVLERAQRANDDLVKLVGEHMETLEVQNSILDNAAEYAILSDDMSGRILTANRGALDSFGVASEAELRGRRLDELIADPNFRSKRLGEILATTDGGGTWHGLLECRRSDGRAFPARCHIAPRRDRTGNAAGRVMLFRDISREREAERRYGELFHSLQEAVYVTTRDGTFLDANDAMADLLGAESTDDLMRMDARKLYRSAADRQRWLERVERDGFVRDNEVVLRDWKGEDRVCIESTRVLRGSDGSVEAFLGTLVDITERRRLQNQVTRSQKLDAVGTLASGLAHDFNNILSAIVPNADLIEQDTKTPEPVRARARTIRASAERAGGITRQLLRFARQDRDTNSIADLNQIADEAARLLEPGFPAEVRFEVALSDAPMRVTGEASGLEQVVVNLVLNARDACSSGDVVRVSTDHRLVTEPVGELRPGEYCVLSVADTGEGISAAKLERIFDPFFTTKASGVGTGLGLSVVYAIVQGSGGHIRVESERGKGTRFEVFLPHVKVRAESASTPA